MNDRSVSWNRSCAESSQAWSLPAMHSRLYRNGIQHSAIGCTFACSPRSGRLGWIARISRSRRTTALRRNWSRASLATIWISRKRSWQWRIPNIAGSRQAGYPHGPGSDRDRAGPDRAGRVRRDRIRHRSRPVRIAGLEGSRTSARSDRAAARRDWGAVGRQSRRRAGESEAVTAGSGGCVGAASRDGGSIRTGAHGGTTSDHRILPEGRRLRSNAVGTMSGSRSTPRPGDGSFAAGPVRASSSQQWYALGIRRATLS